MPSRPRDCLTRPTAPPDLETLLFARLVESVLRWPCPHCGKSGLCDCYQPESAQPEAEAAEPQEGIGHG